MPTAQSILERKGGEVQTIPATATVLEAAHLMNERRIGALVVVEDERAVGIFTERDILNRVVAAERSPAETRVKEVMTSPMACCRRDTKLADCRAVMTQKRIRHLPVVEDGELFGMISSGDILALESDDRQAAIEYLHEYLYRHR
ncbi:MAG: CBS domain-containing protein [Planctomycetota bacterium]|nr:MAG: CBS domain-containing protein [Planctomycetota bacterium]